MSEHLNFHKFKQFFNETLIIVRDEDIMEQWDDDNEEEEEEEEGKETASGGRRRKKNYPHHYKIIAALITSLPRNAGVIKQKLLSTLFSSPCLTYITPLWCAGFFFFFFVFLSSSFTFIHELSKCTLAHLYFFTEERSKKKERGKKLPTRKRELIRAYIRSSSSGGGEKEKKREEKKVGVPGDRNCDASKRGGRERTRAKASFSLAFDNFTYQRVPQA